ncbi:MAG: hypothetical protein SWX82_18365 [Cyanobacteriota bacterium]|nr:hypothetical protein [Cyanobacteriota bacterium]
MLEPRLALLITIFLILGNFTIFSRHFYAIILTATNLYSREHGTGNREQWQKRFFVSGSSSTEVKHQLVPCHSKFTEGIVILQ